MKYCRHRARARAAKPPSSSVGFDLAPAPSAKLSLRVAGAKEGRAVAIVIVSVVLQSTLHHHAPPTHTKPLEGH